MLVLGAAACASFASVGNAQDLKRVATPDDDDHAIVFELGAAGDWDPAEGTVHKGGTFAFEITPIEHWIELEIGLTALAADRGIEMPVDVLFKKPWRLSPQFEFMIGGGAELAHATGPNHGTFWGAEAVLDFMFWSRKDIGWYVEPGYEVTFRTGARHHGMGIAVGLLIGR